MVIDPKTGLGSLSAQNSQKAQPRAAERSVRAEPQPQAPADSVQLSDRGKSMKRLEDSIAKAPVVNEDKVAALKAAIADGSYKIDAQRLAEKILVAEGI